MIKTSKQVKHLQPMEKLARNIIIRGWLDSVGHSVSDSSTPKQNIIRDAKQWIGCGNYYYWGNVAGVEEKYMDELYTKFYSAYNEGKLKDANPYALLTQLFERI